MPIIGPIPKIKRTNFAEFFVWPNSLFFLFDLVLIFFVFLFFMKDILLHRNFKNFRNLSKSLKKIPLESNLSRDHKNSILYNVIIKKQI